MGVKTALLVLHSASRISCARWGAAPLCSAGRMWDLAVQDAYTQRSSRNGLCTPRRYDTLMARVASAGLQAPAAGCLNVYVLALGLISFVSLLCEKPEHECCSMNSMNARNCQPDGFTPT